MRSQDKDASIESWQVRVIGRVQGVGYREACVQCAQALGLTGWVRNRQDGSVEALLHGGRTQLLQMQRWLRIGPPDASVLDVQVTELSAPVNRFELFERWPTE